MRVASDFAAGGPAAGRSRHGAVSGCIHCRAQSPSLNRKFLETQIMFKLSDSAWWHSFTEELNADAEWTKAAKYFSGQIQFNHDNGHSTLAVVAGKAVAAFADGIPLGADIVVGGPNEEWQR